VKKLLYYGTERTDDQSLKGTPGEPIPHYRKQVWSRELKEGDDEAKVRQEIETRCRSNPEYYPLRLPPSMRVHFQWIELPKSVLE
jgi:hypothetical protein